MGTQVRYPGRPLASTTWLCDVVPVMALGLVGRPRSRKQSSAPTTGAPKEAPKGVPKGVPTGRIACALAAASLVLGPLAGCTRSVAIVPPLGLTADVRRTCEALAAALPYDLDPIGERRTVTPESMLTAAWGDPPAAMRCGVADPTALTPTATLVEVNGVDWFPEELTDGYLMTTVGRVANVELIVPRAIGPAPSLAAGLADAIKATVPLMPAD